MTEHGENHAVERLEAFIGEWSMEAMFPNSPRIDTGGHDTGARTVFEWLPGRRFLVQRWEVPHPAAPDGIAIIGFDRDKETYLQHYFDSRGVARLYEMSFTDGIWKLSRNSADFSPLEFSQRYAGIFSDDRKPIRGSWESSNDGLSWDHDFELNYTKVK
jgi:hypothetical protein